MMEQIKKIGDDFDGTELVTDAIMDMLQTFPDLYTGERFEFASMSEEGGLAIYPMAGSAVTSRTTDITDHVTEVCLYQFGIVCRNYGLTERRRITTKEWLDTLGRWLERQPINVDGVEHQLDKYPKLTGSRTIKKITRLSPAYCDSINENKSENWAITMSLTYEHEYQL